ncbi:hypothetical protein GH714_014981 [Hevea brasiliensis]|uniref:Vacuolar protein 14 C-terminal Fig4-binding domain-containing protein n=1 Tax=Hevea brasiliensis TaxID=3981 RepID=A0A6A6M2K4_HEVBR|nr:hypothetical protein GH714_014884 [Hevea brasiliensis]KAF2306179.1 hypothetical protein GH714_014981 [Hevea brasiliensis]
MVPFTYGNYKHLPIGTDIPACKCGDSVTGRGRLQCQILVQLDKLIRLIETPIFAYLRLQLLEPGSYMCGKQIKRTSSDNPYSQFLHHIPSGSQISEDGDVNQEVGNSSLHNGINFGSRLQQFEQMQSQHHMHAKSQAQSRNNSTSLKEAQRPEDPRPQTPAAEMNRPPSRSSRTGPGQLQL